MLDLDSITQAQTASVDIVHPLTNQPTGARVTLAGPEHPTRKALKWKRQRQLRAQYQKAGRVVFGDPEEDEAETIEVLAACTLGWEGIADDGQPVAFSEAAARELYARPELAWLRAQLAAALEQQEVFIKTSGSA
jgi:hypothetical protein